MRRVNCEWLHKVIRRGLNEVSEKIFKLVCVMEIEVKCYLSKDRSQGDIRSELAKLIVNSEPVKVHWDHLSSEWEEEESTLLFNMVTGLWVTMRGFSLAVHR